MKKIGIQLYTLKEEMDVDFFNTLEKVAEIGYEGVEFAGYYGKSASEIKEKLAQLNLSVAGSHLQYELLFNDLDNVIKFEKEIGNELLVCPWATFDTLAEWEQFFVKLNEAGEKIKAAGLQLAYHNHAHEFKTFNDKTIMDYMLEQTNEEFVKLELDTYWTDYAAIDTLEFIAQHQNRLVSLHIKDMKLNPTKSTEVGTGILPVSSFINAAKNVEWYIVEQEAFDKAPIDSVKISFDHMEKIISK